VLKVAGSYQVVAQSAWLPTVPFDLTNGSGAASQMIAQFPSTPQSTYVGTAFTTPLCLVLSDQFDNPVDWVSVTFSPPAAPARRGPIVTFSAPLTQPSGTFTGGLTVNQEVTDGAGLASGGLLRAGFDAVLGDSHLQAGGRRRP
jgi:hypothetical protein